MAKILIIGACGQIGTELTKSLRQKHGNEEVIASDIRPSDDKDLNSGPFEILDVMDFEAIEKLCLSHKIEEVYLLAALLSATAEQKPMFAWELNMKSLFNLLNLAKENKIKKLFWPSSIAVFGPTTPRENTPQYTVMEPSTVYGISKQAGERWCEYYHQQYGVDVRSIRYPGLISYSSPPGGGTTDYAVDIFYKAKAGEKFSCFLEKDTPLPMMYMEDAIRATIQLMEAPSEQVKIRSSYNVSSFSFTPERIYEEIKQHFPEFEIEYNPDFRQKIANSWPASINDEEARSHWNWKEKYTFRDMVKDMFDNL